MAILRPAHPAVTLQSGRTMKILRVIVASSVALATFFAVSTHVAAQAASAPAATPAAALPADPWPRDVSISNAALLIYQPQVNTWVDNKLDFRSAMAIKPTGAKEETFGVVFATARTQVDKVARTVVFENLQITKLDFPTLPDHGAGYRAELQKRLTSDVK